MTVNQIIEAIAFKLKQLYPDRYVYDGEIPKGADGNFYVHCSDQSHSRNLNRRRSRSYTFEVLYFKSKKDSMHFNDWAEQMYFEFERLQVGNRTVSTTDAQAEDGRDMVYHFTFDVNITGLIDQLADDPMANLKIEEALKKG